MVKKAGKNKYEGVDPFTGKKWTEAELEEAERRDTWAKERLKSSAKPKITPMISDEFFRDGKIISLKDLKEESNSGHFTSSVSNDDHSREGEPYINLSSASTDSSDGEHSELNSPITSKHSEKPPQKLFLLRKILSGLNPLGTSSSTVVPYAPNKIESIKEKSNTNSK